MKKILLLALSFILLANLINAQTYKTRDGYVYFNPNKDLTHKDYEASSKEGTAIFKVETSDVAFLVPMKTFHFNNALLEEHFNENYLHTNKFPNATYKGKLIGFEKSMLAKDGEYKISSVGTVTMHGVSNSFKSPVTLIVKGNAITFKCDFPIKAADYNVEIPGLVKGKLLDATPIMATLTFKK